MKASIALQVLPKVTDNDKVLEIVDEVISHIKGTGLNYHVGPFETTIEGELDELMDIVKECQHIATEAGSPSVMSYVKIHYNPEGGVFTIDEKVTKHSR